MVSKESMQGNTKKIKKTKYKKDALLPVDVENEFKTDPKYKTELCTTFNKNNFCPYGNKCRFAHGKQEMFDKQITHPKYRKNNCLTFHDKGFCTYGLRCHFKHNEDIVFSELNRSYYFYLLKVFPLRIRINPKKRLNIFNDITQPLNKENIFNFQNEFTSKLIKTNNYNNRKFSFNSQETSGTIGSMESSCSKNFYLNNSYFSSIKNIFLNEQK